jgi:quercetin dioxygenase-like cupin family protein
MTFKHLWQRTFRLLGKLCLLVADGDSFTAVDADELAWSGGKHRTAAVTFYMKSLYEDKSTGTEFKLVRYPAGEINPDHSHSVSHGMYVLQGELVTHKGTFGAGSFVWFPKNEVMRHGAGPAAEVVVLFFSDAEMRTRYVSGNL